MLKINVNSFLGYEENKMFLKTNPIIVLKAFFIITILMITQLFNNFLVSQMTIKRPFEMINDFNDLIKLKFTLMFPNSFTQMFKNENSQLEKLFRNSLNKSNNIYSYFEFFTKNHLINDLCNGRHAMVTYEAAVKIKLIQMAALINKQVKIRSLEEYSKHNLLTIFLNRHLNTNLRRDLNNRFGL